MVSGRQEVSRIPLLTPDLPPLEALIPRYEHIFNAKRATNFGGLVVELEEKLSKALGCYVVTTANGTLALELALTLLELRPGSQVACPALTFPATATAICRAGHLPRFVDANAESWCSAANEFSFGGGNDSALVPVSAFGYGLQASQFVGVGVPLVIDAAPAWGNQSALPGAIACFSLHATKGLIAGEGGAMAIHDEKQAKRARALTNFGMGTGLVGTNGKMSEYHAAVALASLDTWPERSESRRRAECFYFQALEDAVPALEWQDWDSTWTRTIYPVLLPAGSDIERIMCELDEAGVETRRWYHPLVCDQYQFGGPSVHGVPTARSLGARILGLPFFTGISHAQMERVAKCLATALRGS